MSWVGIRDPGQESVRLLPWIGINYKEGHQFDCATVLSEDNSFGLSLPILNIPRPTISAAAPETATTVAGGVSSVNATTIATVPSAAIKPPRI